MSRLPVAAARPAPTTALPAELQADQLPAHVAVIMDGKAVGRASAVCPG